MKIRAYWSRSALIQWSVSLDKHRERRRSRKDGGGDWSEVPQGKDHPGPPKLEEARKDLPLEALERVWPC